MIIYDSINTRENELIETINLFTEWQEKYEYIVDFEKATHVLEKPQRMDKYLVKGCQSKVWLHSKVVDGKFQYYSFGDAPIPKGLAAILCFIYSGSQVKEIQSFNSQFLKKTGLINYLSPIRRMGLEAMQNRFKELAKQING